ncbi:hypothetical protein [Amycolatopsis kentuckyensis]|uniref:hypothetical protein n=1 Tax=Amycolatopsis kentuckyensis TaxID=218823 RepID=UPI0035696573
MAIVAAVLSTGSTGIAIWQAKSAKRSADIAEEDLAESRKQTAAAEQAAAAAEQQVAEARRQNEITEEQLHLAREELEAGRHRDRQTQAARHVATVHEVRVAAEALQDELRSGVAAVIEYQVQVRRPGLVLGIIPPLLLGRAESEWDTAVNKIRVDKPSSPTLMTAIDAFDKYAKSVSKAIWNAQEKATDYGLSNAAEAALVRLVDGAGDQHEALKRACDEFFAANGVAPGDLTAP